jgi:hypothetical protein
MSAAALGWLPGRMETKTGSGNQRAVFQWSMVATHRWQRST